MQRDPFPEPAEPVEPVEPSAAAARAAAADERLAEARRSAIEAGRRKGGLAGAALAGSMLALRDIYEGPPKDQLPIEIEASGTPVDVDVDGVSLQVGDVDVSAPPLDRRDPV